jgi:hypothetical protein
MQPCSASRQLPVIQNLTVQRMDELVALGHAAAGKRLRVRPSYDVMPAGQLLVELLQTGRIDVSCGTDHAGEELCRYGRPRQRRSRDCYSTRSSGALLTQLFFPFQARIAVLEVIVRGRTVPAPLGSRGSCRQRDVLVFDKAVNRGNAIETPQSRLPITAFFKLVGFNADWLDLAAARCRPARAQRRRLTPLAQCLPRL